MAPHPGATAGEMDPKTQRTQRRRAEARKSLKHPQVPGSAEQETGREEERQGCSSKGRGTSAIGTGERK